LRLCKLTGDEARLLCGFVNLLSDEARLLCGFVSSQYEEAGLHKVLEGLHRDEYGLLRLFVS